MPELGLDRELFADEEVAGTGLHSEATVMKREYRVRGREKMGKKDKKVKKKLKYFVKRI